MSQDYPARIAALEDALRQKDSQLSLVAETESFLRSALARAEEKIENEEREIEHLRAQIKNCGGCCSAPVQKNFADRLKTQKPC
ncbi:protein encoded within IS [Enterobacter sp. ODB01]|nr:protein encoded within IS [Enterobacter sp. ODB01]